MCISGGSVSLTLGFTLCPFFLDVFLRTGMYLCQNTDGEQEWYFRCATKNLRRVNFYKFYNSFTFAI